MRLLSRSHKTDLSDTYVGNLDFYMHYMSPSDYSSVANVCPYASKQCRAVCLTFAGMGAFANVQRARNERVKAYVNDPIAYVAQLQAEIDGAVEKARRRGKAGIAVRLNGMSDLDWSDVYAAYQYEASRVRFYEYTKAGAWKRGKLLNLGVYLTYSLSEKLESAAESHEWRKYGVNTAVVFPGKVLPERYTIADVAYPVIDGDLHDARWLDRQGVVVGLRAKGKAKKLKAGGFVR